MTQSEPVQSPEPLRSVDQGGYRKGEETQARILAAALLAFGENGFAAVTTRQIAEASEVNLPALTYYFGSKEGLYLACAQDIVKHYYDGVGEIAGAAQLALVEPMEPELAAGLLKQLMAALARFLLESSVATSRTLFVQREIASPGPAFEILYTQLWRPGIELAAELIARASPGIDHESDARLRSAMMISSLTGLVQGHDIIARTIGHPDLVTAAIALIDEQIDQLGMING